MKYRDIILLFISIVFILSIGFVFGVNFSYWPLSLILFIVLIVVVYKLWIEE